MTEATAATRPPSPVTRACECSRHGDPVPDALAEMETALQRARLALRESEDDFRLLVSNIPGAVYRRALDPDMTIAFVSDAIEQITGHTAADLTSSRARTFASLVHPEDRVRIAEEVRAAVREGHHYGLAYRIVRADGEVAWVGDRGQAMHQDNAAGDSVASLYGTLTDITDRKRMEQDRDRIEVELRMAQKLEAVGQLASGIAHEINTPVQFVGDSVRFLADAFGDIEILLETYRHECEHIASDGDRDAVRARLQAAETDADYAYLQERVPAALQRTLEGIDRVASIVRALKEFAHPHTAQAPADLNRAIASTLTVARNEYKYVATAETAFADLPPVLCNLSDLNQVFLNLIVNAAHAIEDRQAAADSSPDQAPELGTIRISTRHAADTVLISVSDTGCGIPDAIRTRIFDPFFTTKGVGRGSGQGLAIARAVIQKHGGSLTFTTKPGAGTTFTIELPLAGASSS